MKCFSQLPKGDTRTISKHPRTGYDIVIFSCTCSKYLMAPWQASVRTVAVKGGPLLTVFSSWLHIKKFKIKKQKKTTFTCK